MLDARAIESVLNPSLFIDSAKLVKLHNSRLGICCLQLRAFKSQMMAVLFLKAISQIQSNHNE